MTNAPAGDRGASLVEGSGTVEVSHTASGMVVHYRPEAGKTRHGFFPLGSLSGADLDPERESILKLEVVAGGSSPGAASPETAFVLFLRPRDATQLVDATRLKLYAGDTPRTVSFALDNAVLQDGAELVLRVHRDYVGELSLRDLRLIAGVGGRIVRRPVSPGPLSHVDEPFDPEADFVQDGAVLIAGFLDEEVRFRLPEDWRLATVSDERLAVVDDFLFGNLRRRILGQPRLLETTEERKNFNNALSHRTLLSFSAGEDSTAALCVLSPDTPKYFVKRPFASFHTSSGRRVSLSPPFAESHARAKVPDCIVVESDMELLNTKFGGRMGNPATVSVVVVGILLASHVGAGSVSIGAQLETSYLQNGRHFIDVHALPSSVFNKYRRLFNYADLDISYPVACLSEVLTSRVVADNSDRFFSVPCPHTDQELQACGQCYKCFRKLQLAGSRAPAPDAKTRELLKKRPLKMATSAIYAARMGGTLVDDVTDFGHVDLGFLERYYDRAIETLVPRGLRAHIRQHLADMGLEPMGEADVRALRTVGRELAPELHRDELAFPRQRGSDGSTG